MRDLENVVGGVTYPLTVTMTLLHADILVLEELTGKKISDEYDAAEAIKVVIANA